MNNAQFTKRCPSCIAVIPTRSTCCEACLRKRREQAVYLAARAEHAPPPSAPPDASEAHKREQVAELVRAGFVSREYADELLGAPPAKVGEQVLAHLRAGPLADRIESGHDPATGELRVSFGAQEDVTKMSTQELMRVAHIHPRTGEVLEPPSEAAKAELRKYLASRFHLGD